MCLARTYGQTRRGRPSGDRVATIVNSSTSRRRKKKTLCCAVFARRRFYDGDVPRGKCYCVYRVCMNVVPEQRR